MSEIATSDSLKYHLAEISVKLNNFVLQHHQNDFLFLNTTFLVLHVADFDHRQADFFHFQPDFFQNNIFSLTFLDTVP